ncbi:hypothetical protein RRG08_032436 [Elysia crispata]|uniref:Uncharacterized protein n=1 Tax=Elysia crispata TaxID=231223 RepID=A0AAE1E1M1_9GAST|nr:hypothetical protein RRG08_032436 [Elysia crispata]
MPGKPPIFSWIIPSRPVKRSRSTRYDGARQSSCMPWVWCGSSHNTLVIHWRIDAGREVLSDGCVRTTTSSEVPATREKLYGEKYVWFIIAWYPDNWYKVKDNCHICTVEQQEEALIDWRKEG